MQLNTDGRQRRNDHMSEIERRPAAEAEYDGHLRRNETVWNRWSNWYQMSEHDVAPIRNQLISALGFLRGDRVLDIGCGPGVNFELIRNAIGATGEVVAIDDSPKMVEKARKRVDTHGWEQCVP